MATFGPKKSSPDLCQARNSPKKPPTDQLGLQLCGGLLGMEVSMAPARWFPSKSTQQVWMIWGYPHDLGHLHIYSKPWKDRNVDLILHDFGRILLFYLFGACFCSWIDWYDGFAIPMFRPRWRRSGIVLIPWAVHETGEGTTLPDTWNHLVANLNT